MYNILFCSVGRRCILLKDIKQTIGSLGSIIATDCNSLAPALAFADKTYIVPRISDPKYISIIADICEKENIKAILTLIDPEIELLSKNREYFENKNILVLVPSLNTAQLCFNKYEMYKYLKNKGIPTIQTFIQSNFLNAYNDGFIKFPVFIKPICGSGSIGAKKISNLNELNFFLNDSTDEYIIQEFMIGDDCGADVYVDCFSHKAVSIFSKMKLETRVGGACKTISFKDQKLFDFIRQIVDLFDFNGPIDMDFFYKDGKYYLSEINPRFGGAYIHAHAAGVDFVQLMLKNIEGITNQCRIGEYDDDVVMMMYDDIVIKRKEEVFSKPF